jgi:hypothetical protein
MPMHAAMIANPGTCSVGKISAGLSRSLCQVLIHQCAKMIGPRMMPASTVRADNTPYLMRKMVEDVLLPDKLVTCQEVDRDRSRRQEEEHEHEGHRLVPVLIKRVISVVIGVVSSITSAVVVIGASPSSRPGGRRRRPPPTLH